MNATIQDTAPTPLNSKKRQRLIWKTPPSGGTDSVRPVEHLGLPGAQIFFQREPTQ
jgi:hypothetical protein